MQTMTTIPKFGPGSNPEAQAAMDRYVEDYKAGRVVKVDREDAGYLMAYLANCGERFTVDAEWNPSTSGRRTVLVAKVTDR